MKKTIISLTLFCLLVFSFLVGNSLKAYAKPAESSSDDFSAKALYLIDYNTGEVLFEQNKDEKMPVASIVKLMTINIVCEEIENGNLKLDDVVTVSENASGMGGSQVFLETDGEYTVGDLLKSVIVSSANDASVALAEKICGSEENFVSLMNKKAKEYGLKNTNYVNCTGLPASNQFSCAYDTAILLKNVTKHETYHNYSTIWMDTLKHKNNRESELVNTNKLIRYFEGCDGGKTGSTNEAGYCLSATAKRKDMRLIAVVLGAKNGKSRFAETSRLLNFGFDNFENKKVVDKTNILENKVKVNGGKVDFVSVKAKDDIFVLNKKHDDNNIVVKTKLSENVDAPIKKGSKLGEIFVIKNDVVVAKSDLISCEDVEQSGIFDNISKIVENFKIA